MNQEKATVISFFCSKGGIGKSTISVNLTISLMNLGYNVLFIDADVQGTSSSYFAERANQGMDTSEVVQKTTGLKVYVDKVSHKYDFIVIDSQGADTTISRESLLCANWVFSPFSYSGFDVRELRKTVSVITDAQAFNTDLKSFLLPNMVEKRNKAVNRREKDKAKAIVYEVLETKGLAQEKQNIFFLNTEISHKSAYSEMDCGKSIFELTKGKTCDPSLEYQSLLNETVDIIESITKEVA